MTRRKTLALASALLAAAAMPLLAHDDKIHKATVGEVSAATSEGLELKTKTGVVKVRYSSRTKFELNKKPADKAAVKTGDRVGVIGSKLPTGEIMANELILGLPAPAAASPLKKNDHKH
jgi:hypothetical protein